MSLRHAYAPMLPEFDSFLFASVGEEADGAPLSVLSALSQLDLDPRDEAARLSHLTKEMAADQLARMIARLSDKRWTLSEARGSRAGSLSGCRPQPPPANQIASTLALRLHPSLLSFHSTWRY